MGFIAALKSFFSNNSNHSNQQSEVFESEHYKSFTITPTPIKEGGQYRLSATISKGEGDTIKIHSFIRSDVIANQDVCIEMTIRKAKLAIDQMGDSIFN